MERRILKQVYY